MDQQGLTVTPRTDREVYTTTANDVGFRVINPALCRELELAIRRAHDHLAPLYDGSDPATYPERDGIDEAFLILRAALRGELPLRTGDAMTREFTAPLLAPEDVFQWTGDWEAFGKWFGEKMPIDFGGQISVPVWRTREGQWLGPYLRVWCGNWIVRRMDEAEQQMRHYTFSDREFRLFIKPHVGACHHEGAAPADAARPENSSEAKS